MTSIHPFLPPHRTTDEFPWRPAFHVAEPGGPAHRTWLDSEGRTAMVDSGGGSGHDREDGRVTGGLVVR